MRHHPLKCRYAVPLRAINRTSLLSAVGHT